MTHYLSSTEKALLNELLPTQVVTVLHQFGWQITNPTQLPQLLQAKGVQVLSKRGYDLIIVPESFGDWKIRLAEAVFQFAKTEDLSIYEALHCLSTANLPQPIFIDDDLQVDVYDDQYDDRYVSIDSTSGSFGLCISSHNIPKAISALLNALAYFRARPSLPDTDELNISEAASHQEPDSEELDFSDPLPPQQCKPFTQADHQQFDQISAQEAAIGQRQSLENVYDQS